MEPGEGLKAQGTCLGLNTLAPSSLLLILIFHLVSSDQVYRKRFPKKSNRDSNSARLSSIKKRTRQKSKSPRAPRAIAKEVYSAGTFHFKVPLRSQPSPRRYRLQERAIYSIHHFLASMFVGGSERSWSANQLGFVGPDGTELQPGKWSDIESSCDSISILLRCNQIAPAQEILRVLRCSLDTLVNPPDPLFLGKIWRLGLVLHGLDRRAPQLQAMLTVLGRLREICRRLYGNDSPVSAILNCIVEVDKVDFTPTMRLGFRETLATLDHHVQDENIMMLNLWSTYAQYFSKPYVKFVKRKSINATSHKPPRTARHAARKRASETSPQERLRDYIQKDVLLFKFDQVWHECYNPQHLSPEKWQESDACIRISYHFAYAAFWVCEKGLIGMKLAEDIIKDTRHSVKMHSGRSLKATAYSVACKIVATVHRRNEDINKCEKTLKDAIDILSCGDQTSRIKAMSLCLTLASWRREWRDLNGSQEAEERLLKIQGSIEGISICPGCRPSLKCDKCFENREDCLKCKISTRKACRTCKNSCSRRRRTVNLRKELFNSYNKES